MWRLLLVLVFLPVGAAMPSARPAAVPLPEPPAAAQPWGAIAAPRPFDAGRPAPDPRHADQPAGAPQSGPVTPGAAPPSPTRLVVECSPPDADQPGLAAVCVYQLAPATP
jgi:hypothetical protein